MGHLLTTIGLFLRDLAIVIKDVAVAWVLFVLYGLGYAFVVAIACYVPAFAGLYAKDTAESLYWLILLLSAIGICLYLMVIVAFMVWTWQKAETPTAPPEEKAAAEADAKALAEAGFDPHSHTDLATAIALTIMVAVSFGFATYLWQDRFGSVFLSYGHDGFLGVALLNDALADAVAVYVLDMVLKGALFDVIEHFGLAFSPVVLNKANLAYMLYAFVLRHFFSFVVVSLIVRYAFALWYRKAMTALTAEPEAKGQDT